MILDAYLERIGYTGPTTPTLETLNGIALAHVQAIPFENIDALLGRPIELAPDAVERKLIRQRRGGYCFEQNGLLLSVLETLGFRATSLGARVRFGRPRDYLPARTHLFARVDIDGEEWLADVGIGGISPTCALRLHTTDAQPTPHETRRIVRRAGHHFHQIQIGQEWQDVCEFTLDEMPPIDRELANWYTSTHPQSHFRNNLLVARALPDGGRATIVNRELTFRRKDGSAETRTLASHRELLDALDRAFGLRFEPGTEIACAGLDWGSIV